MHRLMKVLLAASCAALVISGPALAADVTPSQVAPSQDDSTVLKLRYGSEQRAISRAEIETLPLYEVELRHFEGPEGRFAGVWLDAFLAEQGLATSERLRFIAHDDYTVFLTPEDRREKQYLLVTRLNDEPLSLNEFGPTMLVVPADAAAVEAGKESMASWIWSIRDIQAR